MNVICGWGCRAAEDRQPQHTPLTPEQKEEDMGEMNKLRPQPHSLEM